MIHSPVSCCARSELNDPQLLQQREIVLNVPVVGDPAVLHAQNVGRDKIDRLTASLLLAKSAGEMAAETQVCDHAIAADYKLFNLAAQIRHRLAEVARGNNRSVDSLRPAFWKCAICEVIGERQSCELGISGIPERIENPGDMNRRLRLICAERFVDRYRFRLWQLFCQYRAPKGKECRAGSK